MNILQTVFVEGLSFESRSGLNSLEVFQVFFAKAEAATTTVNILPSVACVDFQNFNSVLKHGSSTLLC